ncbi:hypothetical protein, variant [Capsaspora owczarzaki ATCC 30864]|uniref:tRNA (uracil-O(2)-)-methyltransferase n=1 Tax=Capsaspora owczarzaki (strain ATCC 30864) TaxID=595528 RepID=A0A0D2X0K7_CAPO3|nr:hypothetical protein, variant [Capsaspora owczarzaki ATCC 30864]
MDLASASELLSTSPRVWMHVEGTAPPPSPPLDRDRFLTAVALYTERPQLINKRFKGAAVLATRPNISLEGDAAAHALAALYNAAADWSTVQAKDGSIQETEAEAEASNDSHDALSGARGVAMTARRMIVPRARHGWFSEYELHPVEFAVVRHGAPLPSVTLVPWVYSVENPMGVGELPLVCWRFALDVQGQIQLFASVANAPEPEATSVKVVHWRTPTQDQLARLAEGFVWKAGQFLERLYGLSIPLQSLPTATTARKTNPSSTSLIDDAEASSSSLAATPSSTAAAALDRFASTPDFTPAAYVPATLSASNLPFTAMIDVETFLSTYDRLKATYGWPLAASWSEKTDASKFVFEDVVIASYLLCLWELPQFCNPATKLPQKQRFVDLGCGNGLLVWILSREGHTGYGVDLAARDIWTRFSGEARLEVRAIHPNVDVFPEADWLIGNHSDELTPWMPFMAMRSSPSTKYIVIPCCTFDLFCRFQKTSFVNDVINERVQRITASEQDHLLQPLGVAAAPTTTVSALEADAAAGASSGGKDSSLRGKRRHDGSPAITSSSASTYVEYLHYTRQLGRVCGFNVYTDVLRIPSTKKVCHIGVPTLELSEALAAPSASVSARVDELLDANWMSCASSAGLSAEEIDVQRAKRVFIARSATQEVVNCTQLPPDFLQAAVRVVLAALTTEDKLASGPVLTTWDGRPWRRGGEFENKSQSGHCECFLCHVDDFGVYNKRSVALIMGGVVGTTHFRLDFDGRGRTALLQRHADSDEVQSRRPQDATQEPPLHV